MVRPAFWNGRKMKIKFYANSGKPEAKMAVGRLSDVARSLGLETVASVSRAPGAVVIALGGDGTILRAVHRFPDSPVLGFNLGSLGYLASVGEREFEKALAMLAQGRFKVSERTMLEVRRVGGEVLPRRALNDVVVVREMTGHAAVVDLAVNGRAAARYMADGLVIATPTGSTAYSLSAGGPVLMQDSGGLVVTPMNPHALGIRPMVVRDTVELKVSSRRRVNGRAERIGVYVDGENVTALGGGEVLIVSKSPYGARLIELDGYDPYEVMSRKLGWTK
jgi:NAD+ kinase